MSTPWSPPPTPSDAEYFLNLLDELRARSSFHASAYDAIRAAGLLRILLTDPPLIHKVQRMIGVRYRFGVTMLMQARTTPAGFVWFTGIMLDPEVAKRLMNRADVPEHERDGLRQRALGSEVHLDRLLGLKVVAEGGNARSASVVDLVRLFANKMGGAHRDDVGDYSKNELLNSLLPDYEPILRQTVIAVSRIVLRALEGLELEMSLQDRPGLFGLDMGSQWAPTTDL